MDESIKSRTNPLSKLWRANPHTQIDHRWTSHKNLKLETNPQNNKIEHEIRNGSILKENPMTGLKLKTRKRRGVECVKNGKHAGNV